MLDGKNWENAETAQRFTNPLRNYAVIGHTFAGNYSMNTYPTLYFRNWRSAVSLCHKNRAQITLYVCEALPSMIVVASQKLFCIV